MKTKGARERLVGVLGALLKHSASEGRLSLVSWFTQVPERRRQSTGSTKGGGESVLRVAWN